MRFALLVLEYENVCAFQNGELCISILHPPVDDPHSGEQACERWNPTQNVRTVLLSVISLLNEPNTSSPANVDASIMYRKWKDTNGTNDEYVKIVKYVFIFVLFVSSYAYFRSLLPMRIANLQKTSRNIKARSRKRRRQSARDSRRVLRQEFGAQKAGR